MAAWRIRLDLHRLAIDDVLQGAAVEKLHGDEALAFLLADFIDGANVWMIQSGSRASFAADRSSARGSLVKSSGRNLSATKRPSSVSSAL